MEDLDHDTFDVTTITVRIKSKVHTPTTGMKIIVSSADMDSEHSYTSNSCVSSLVEQNVVVGRIISLFEHTVLSNTGVFAYQH